MILSSIHPIFRWIQPVTPAKAPEKWLEDWKTIVSTSFCGAFFGQKDQGANVKLPNLHKVNLWEGVDKTQMSFHPPKKKQQQQIGAPNFQLGLRPKHREVRCFFKASRWSIFGVLVGVQPGCRKSRGWWLELQGYQSLRADPTKGNQW